MSENNIECLCGRKRQKMNDTNWKRHVTACNVAKLKSSKTVSNIFSYMKKKGPLMMKCTHLYQIKVIFFFKLAIKKNNNSQIQFRIIIFLQLSTYLIMVYSISLI